MNLDARNRVLDLAERSLDSAYGGRSQSEASFLQRLLLELGCDLFAAPLSPANLFRAALHNRPLMQKVRDVLEVLAVPSERLKASLCEGDWILRAVPGTGDVGHISVLASGDLLSPATLSSEGIASESVQPGYYGLVIEAGAFPHSLREPFARRVLDGRGRVPPNTLVLRPRYPDFGALTDFPPDEPETNGAEREVDIESDIEGREAFTGCPVAEGIGAGEQVTPQQESRRASASEDTLEESVSVDDVANEMNGLRCRFLSDHRASRADGSVRGFAAGALLTIDNWNGTGDEATVAGFSVLKLVLAPAPESVSGIRRYDVALDAQRTAVLRNTRELADWVAREGQYRRNHGTWERERARLETLLARRKTTYSRMWVLQMMYNRFDVDIALWVRHYNTQLSPATALDANIVKSMLYQESRMGTSGAHLMPPPSDWSSSASHPIRSRFNIGQAIDSWGPQQWLMMREMAAAIFTRHGLSAFDRSWMSMSNDDYAAHAPFIRGLREFFEFRDANNRNVMGTTGRDLHEDYGFWIRTAIRWLFVKYANLRRPTWAEAVRAYNGDGARARAYRDAVIARVGSTDPFAAESLDEAPNDFAGEENVAVEPPGRWLDATGATPRVQRDDTGLREALVEQAPQARFRIVFYDEDSLRYLDGWTRATGPSAVVLINRRIYDTIRADGAKRALAYDQYVAKALAAAGRGRVDLMPPSFSLDPKLATVPLNRQSRGDWDDLMITQLIIGGRHLTIQSQADQWALINRLFAKAKEDARQAAQAQRQAREFVAYFVLDTVNATLAMVEATNVTMRNGHAVIPLATRRGTDWRVLPGGDAAARVIGDIHTHYLLDPLIDLSRSSIGMTDRSTRTSLHSGVSDDIDVVSARDDHIVVYAVDSKYLHRANPDGTKNDKLSRSGDVLREALRVFGGEPGLRSSG